MILRSDSEPWRRRGLFFWQLVNVHPSEFVAFFRFVIEDLAGPRIAVHEEIYVRHLLHSVHDSCDGEIVSEMSMPMSSRTSQAAAPVTDYPCSICPATRP